MKWIGQHIYDQISRFRNDVYLEDISTGTIASGGHLGLDSNNKIVKAVDGGGDLTSIIAGAGLSGQDLTGPVPKLDLDAQHGGINLIHNEALVVGGSAESQIDFATENKIKFKTNNANQVEIIDGAILPITNNDIDLGGDPDLHFKDLWLRGNANISGNVSGTWTGAVIPSAKLDAANITSLGTLTTLTVDEITIDGDTITASDDLNIVAVGNDITVDADNFTIESATSVKPSFTLKATVNSNKPANLAFVKDKGAAGANGDYVGETFYVSDNDAQEQINMATVSCRVEDATDGAEEGVYTISVKNTSSATTPRPSLTLTGDGAVTNATIGYGVSSRINIAGVLVMNGTDTINNSGVIQVAAQTVIDHDQLANFAANEHFTQADITTVGTIGTGTWQGTAISSAYLDADTAHLTTDQTFTGVKTFNEAINKKSLNFIFVSNKFVNSTANETYFSLGDSDRDVPKGSEDGIGVVAVMPCNGVLRQVEMVSSSNLSGRSWTYRLYRIPSGTAYTSEILVATVAASAGAAGNTNATISLVTDPGDGTNDITYETGYSATTMFTKGDRALFSLQSNSDAAGTPKINTTFCFELDESTI